MMIDREKVIKGLECCRNRINEDLSENEDACNECPYGVNGSFCSPWALYDDALALLEKQEPKWHVFHYRKPDEEEKQEHPDWEYIIDVDCIPNNGEEFLFYRKGFACIGIDTWDDDMWAEYGHTGDGEPIEDGDAWMELPKKPGS